MLEQTVKLTVARVEIDGAELLVLKAPLKFNSEEQSLRVTLQMSAWKFPFVLATPQADGRYIFEGLGTWPEKLTSKNLPLSAFHWHTLEIQPPEDFQFPK